MGVNLLNFHERKYGVSIKFYSDTEGVNRQQKVD